MREGLAMKTSVSVSGFAPWRVAATVFEDPGPATKRELRNPAQCAVEGEFSAFYVRSCEGMVLADDIVCALLAVGRQVAVGEEISGQTLVADNPSAFENGEKEARCLPM